MKPEFSIDHIRSFNDRNYSNGVSSRMLRSMLQHYDTLLKSKTGDRASEHLSNMEGDITTNKQQSADNGQSNLDQADNKETANGPGNPESGINGAAEERKASSMETAKALFSGSSDPVVCSKDGADPVTALSIEDAAAYYQEEAPGPDIA